MAPTLFPMPPVPLDAGQVTLTGVADGMEGFVLADFAGKLLGRYR